jgi:hypothetical protein
MPRGTSLSGNRVARLRSAHHRMHFDVYYPSGAAAKELFDLYDAVGRSWTAVHPEDPVTFTPPPPLDPAGSPGFHYLGTLEDVMVRSATRTRVYPPPSASPVRLSVAPALESWMAIGHPDQLRLEHALAGMQTDIARELPASGDLAIQLDVGLFDGMSATADGHDLDNYLFPIARRLTNPGRRVVSAWATKRVGGTSSLAVDHVGGPYDAVGDWEFRAVRTTVSTSGPAWKEAVASAVADASVVAGDSGIDLQLSFVVASRRNWTMLWKPAIDSLGAIFGLAHAAKLSSARDDRVVSLGLHRFVDDSIGNDVHLGICWRPTTTS